jgi:hypothetical protein
VLTSCFSEISSTTLTASSASDIIFSDCVSRAILNRLAIPTSEISAAGVLARLLSAAVDAVSSAVSMAASRWARGMAWAMNRPAAAMSTLCVPGYIDLDVVGLDTVLREYCRQSDRL